MIMYCANLSFQDVQATIGEWHHPSGEAGDWNGKPLIFSAKAHRGPNPVHNLGSGNLGCFFVVHTAQFSTEGRLRMLAHASRHPNACLHTQ